METQEELRQRVWREQKLIARLRLATIHLEDAQLERIWAISACAQEGLSIRQIASATGLSSTRVHQLLNDLDAKEIPVWLSSLRKPNLLGSLQGNEEQANIRKSLIDEVEVLRWCIDWLSRLERGENVVVNLRPQEDIQTEFVCFDCSKVLRVLSRIAADLEELAGIRSETTDDGIGDQQDPLRKHRRRLAIVDPEQKRLTPREERAALREKLGLPPY
ncbi:MAG: hypothetical protein DSM106950_43610 [Stigonema ocellatum SAG 48.90 = DSM 106950]|nr:hypothetical protein [Stigonema ocellatum SAG 48.90 = DSM 106950]